MLAKELEILLSACEVSSLDYFRFSNGAEEIIFRKNQNLTVLDDELLSEGKIQNIPSLYGGRYIDSEKDVTVESSVEKVEKEEKNSPIDINLVTVVSNFIGIASYSDILKNSSEKISVQKGDTLCTVEAMKIYNDITSTVSGTIEEILFKDGDMVECNQELFRIKEI